MRILWNIEKSGSGHLFWYLSLKDRSRIIKPIMIIDLFAYKKIDLIPI
jgi:hypothetical protein